MYSWEQQNKLSLKVSSSRPYSWHYLFLSAISWLTTTQKLQIINMILLQHFSSDPFDTLKFESYQMQTWNLSTFKTLSLYASVHQFKVLCLWTVITLKPHSVYVSLQIESICFDATWGKGIKLGYNSDCLVAPDAIFSVSMRVGCQAFYIMSATFFSKPHTNKIILPPRGGLQSTLHSMSLV